MNNIRFPKDDPVRLLRAVVERMDITKLIAKIFEQFGINLRGIYDREHWYSRGLRAVPV